jgi:putative transposase
MDPRRIALWRYEQIEELLDPELTPHERWALLRRASRVAVRWPGGDDRPISEATLYRWVCAYRKRQLPGLRPTRRQRRRRHARMARSAVEKAIGFLREEPQRSLTMLLALLRTEKIVVARSTLHRHLRKHRAYPALRRAARGNLERRLRRRFQAARPHQIWQCDSKGPFRVLLASEGSWRKLHVFTILDDFSRVPLAVIVTTTPDVRAAIRVFRLAAERYGLPDKIYADRASIFDSKLFRDAIAELGVHRIPSKPGNAPARGKIEAYHRILSTWFVRELPHERVHDVAHAERLLVGLLETVYMDRRHRGIRQTPRQALDDRVSARHVSLDRLRDAFLVRLEKKTHPKTGEVEIAGTLFKVARPHAGARLAFVYDPLDPSAAFLERPDGRREPLRPAVAIIPVDPPKLARGTGRLQALYDHWQGRRLPQAEAAFGLPEIFALFAKHLGRRVPRDELEASTLQHFYRARGPFDRASTEKALQNVFSALGPKRPLASYLAKLSSLIDPPCTS